MTRWVERDCYTFILLNCFLKGPESYKPETGKPVSAHSEIIPGKTRTLIFEEKQVNFQFSKKLKAFTLTELLIVLVIIGILVLVALPNLMPMISKAKSTEAQEEGWVTAYSGGNFGDIFGVLVFGRIKLHRELARRFGRHRRTN